MASTSGVVNLRSQQIQVEKNFAAAWKEVETSIEKIKSGEITEGQTDAFEAVSVVRKIAEEFVKIYCTPIEQSSLEETVKAKADPLPPAMRVMTALKDEELNSYHDLKKELSLIFRLYIEVVALRYTALKESMHLDTHTELVDTLKTVRKNLPYDRLDTRFELEFAKAAILKAAPQSGKWKEIVRQSSSEIGAATFEVLLTAAVLAGTVPVTLPLAIAPAIPPAFALAARIYREGEKKWYKGIWALRWDPEERRVWNAEYLKKTQAVCREYRSSSKIAFYIGEKFMEIIRDPKGDPSLKNEVLDSKDPQDDCEPGLFKLADLNSWRPWKGFWRVRYRAIEHLSEIADLPSLIGSDSKIHTTTTKRCIDQIVKQIAEYKEKNAIYELVERLSSISPRKAEWRAAFATYSYLLLQRKAKEDSKLKSIQNKAFEARKEKETLDTAAKKEKEKNAGKHSAKILNLERSAQTLGKKIEKYEAFEASSKAEDRFLSFIKDF